MTRVKQSFFLINKEFNFNVLNSILVLLYIFSSIALSQNIKECSHELMIEKREVIYHEYYDEWKKHHSAEFLTLLANENQTNKETIEKILKQKENKVQIFIEALSSSNKELKKMAIIVLGGMKKEALMAEDSLVKFLSDEDEEIKRVASMALFQIGIKLPSTIDNLIEAFRYPIKSETEHWFRVDITLLLIKSSLFQPKITLEKLHSNLLNKNPAIRQGIILTLGLIDKNAKLCVPRLLDILNKDEVSDVRATTAHTLGKIKDVASIPSLIQALHDTEFSSLFMVSVDKVAFEALVEIGNQVKPFLKKALKVSSHNSIRGKLINIFNEIKKKEKETD